ncbi:11185_t:CDS:2, partial [Paraglomus occultum]
MVSAEPSARVRTYNLWRVDRAGWNRGSASDSYHHRPVSGISKYRAEANRPANGNRDDADCSFKYHDKKKGHYSSPSTV